MRKGIIFGIICALLLSVPAFAQVTFKDVPPTHWAADSVYELVKMGVTKGYPDGTFRGNNNITRYETAMFIANLANALKKDLGKALVDEAAIGALVAKALQKEIDASAAVSGTVFFDYSKGVSNTNLINNFNITRAYINLTNKFSDNVKTKVTLDAARFGATSFIDFVKYAYADINDVMPKNMLGLPMSIGLRLGQQPTYWPGFADEVLGIRYIAPSLTSNNGVISTADLGVAVMGTIDTGFLSQVNYTIMAVNGTGFTGPETNAGKDLEGRLDLEVFPGLVVAGGGRVKDVGMSTTGPKLGNFLVAYSVDQGAAMGEVMYGENGMGYSVGGRYEVLPAVSVLGRYDSYDPSRGTNNDEQTTIIAGVEYKIRNNVKLAADYQGVTYGSAASTNAGTTVGVAFLHSQIDF
ncbi:MAG: S-layer homology domain-containing protein [Candidatus Margulisiibacteriota bacterium]